LQCTILRVPTSMSTNHIEDAKVAVTTTKKSHATIAHAWLRTKVMPSLRIGVRPDEDPTGQYFGPFSGRLEGPTLAASSSAILASPHVGLSAPGADELLEIGGESGPPARFGLPAPNSGTFLCNGGGSSGLTRTRAFAIRRTCPGKTRSPSGSIGRKMRSNLTFLKQSSCLRRNRFSAANALRGFSGQEEQSRKIDQHLAKCSGTDERGSMSNRLTSA